ncbi:helix-turn-helix domain-containing protein [Azorhizobium caulinodans]|uniref:helix-turn-helix domain-containing protein n=1 Tax=Azorhizobium caulinodans TaxID=7 RepID=UPI003B75D3B3
MTQSTFAIVVGVSQGTVSRWETGDLEPSYDHLASIRKGAHDRRLCWDDAWFFREEAAEWPSQAAEKSGGQL